MTRHIRAMGLQSEADYLAWCGKAGARRSLDKCAEERARERELLSQIEAAHAAQARLHRNPRKFLSDACAGRLLASEIDRPGWREVAAAITKAGARAETRESLAQFLLHLERVSDLVFGCAALGRETRPYADALVRLHARRKLWLREPAAWRPRSHNLERQFASLARHLFARYEVPTFLDSAWVRSDRGAYRFRDWFIHIGRGHNIRTAKTLYPMTKMIAHHFVSAPGDLSIEGALMFADVKTLGGGRRLVDALMGTRLGQRVERDPERRAFWQSVYKFFIANPMLDLRHVGPIVDFLSHQKFESQEILVGPGEVEMRPPPQPHLTMTRRTPESLLRQVEAWHGELRVLRAHEKRYWRPSGVSGLHIRSGPRDRPQEQVFWRVRELMSGHELVEEGRRLRHCVATYADSCAQGRMSIWSMERRRGEMGRAEPALTIAVDANRVVIEARGLANRWPTDAEKQVLDTWMQKANLRAGPYLYHW